MFRHTDNRIAELWAQHFPSRRLNVESGKFCMGLAELLEERAADIIDFWIMVR
jgi:hypothetical protein